jgi:hypothetical protein
MFSTAVIYKTRGRCGFSAIPTQTQTITMA